MFNSRICGIPCQIKVTSYSPAVAGRTWGRYEDCYPDEPEEFDFDVYDRRGRRAKWLERKIRDEDFDKVLADYLSERGSSNEP